MNLNKTDFALYENGMYEKIDKSVNPKLFTGFDIQSKTVDLNMQGGNQIVSNDGKNTYYKIITINKPNTLVPENIKKDVNIGGVIGNFESSSPSSIQELTISAQEITTNGTKTLTKDEGYDGTKAIQFSVNVPSDENIQTNKSVTITTNGTTSVNPDSGYTGLRTVSVTTMYHCQVFKMTKHLS